MIVKHLKRGSQYWVDRIETATFITPIGDCDRLRSYGFTCIVQTNETLAGTMDVVIYHDATGQHWLRPYDEFFDGRFKVIAP